jgi:hypothetical protein
MRRCAAYDTVNINTSAQDQIHRKDLKEENELNFETMSLRNISLSNIPGKAKSLDNLLMRKGKNQSTEVAHEHTEDEGPA